MYVSGKGESKTTKMFFLGLVVGIIINTLAIYFLYYPICKDNWKEVGQNDGRIEMSCEIYKKTKEVFGVLDGEDVIETLGACKDASIVIIKKDTGLTIKVTR